ncbi:alpha/beta hydrolase [Thioclava dalianensis]|uniref:Alpha/beta hydrolase n=1 Tax=Thioclava dalianensis TaxID=1185766 RepID=A0A074U692_9RHOB|nr:alpha/beta hydrolase [Thioclava dalianensis]KEP70162.1 alpha/beta hydrolase [Thioclava dalianensis]SFM80832.1 Acetyl esterase/lipase [Thioclava dalianensis]
MSLQLRILNLILRAGAKRRVAATTDPLRVRREMARGTSWAIVPPRGLCLLHRRCGGMPALSLRVGQVAHDAVVLYLHGGGYVSGSPFMYRGLAGRLSRLSGLEVIVPDYRLAPEHPLPAAVDDAQAAWDDLVAKGYAPDRIILAGDSAGGGLAFLLLARLCAAGTPPAGVIAFSPWTDLSGSGESYRENVATDVILTPARIRKCSEDARGELASDDPSVSPLFANFEAPPPVLIQHSMAELLSDDSLSMAERLRSFGCDVLVQSWPDTPHVWQFFDGRLPEAREALEDAAQAARRMLKM